ncbi:MAG: TIGR02147 family protein [Calothrix sp. SM1_5_4]|nr:TIGR02147 family protein [Calothrix sp. SM1_5_4]
MKTVWIFDYLDYKAYFNAWVESQQRERGEFRRVALALNVSSTLISQVFRGDKNLSMEMACELAEYLALNETEAEYLLLMVEHAKAGSFKLQQRLGRQLRRLQTDARRLEKRLKKDVTLSDSQRAIFYSSYVYSACRLLTDLPEYGSVDAIARHLNLPKNQVQRVVEFLLDNSLCVMKGDRLSMGPRRTHIGSDSPMVNKHHMNWRLLGFQKMLSHDENQAFFTGPMTLSHKVAEAIRKELPEIVSSIMARVEPSPSETSRCLNIDWFEF